MLWQAHQYLLVRLWRQKSSEYHGVIILVAKIFKTLLMIRYLIVLTPSILVLLHVIVCSFLNSRIKQGKRMDNLNLFIDYHYKSIM